MVKVLPRGIIPLAKDPGHTQGSRCNAPHLNDHADKDERRRAYADIYWALLNSPEFILCR